MMIEKNKSRGRGEGEISITREKKEAECPFVAVMHVCKGKQGKPPVLPRETGEKIIVLGRGLRGLPVGTPVGVTRFVEKERVVVAEGQPLTGESDLVVLFEMPVSGGIPATYFWQGGKLGQKMINCPDLSGFKVLKTSVDRSYTVGSGRGHVGVKWFYYLIAKEHKEEALKLLSWARFADFVDKREEDGGFFDILTEAVERRDASLLPEGEMTERHLRPIAEFAIGVMEGEIISDWQPYSSDYPLTLSLWDQHRDEFLQHYPTPVESDELIKKFLLSRRSVFPQPNDGLDELGSAEVVSAAREWARSKEGRLVQRKINRYKGIPFRFGLPKISFHDLEELYIKAGRPVTAEEIEQQLQAEVEKFYPKEIEAEGLNKTKVLLPVNWLGHDSAFKGVVGEVNWSEKEALTTVKPPTTAKRSFLMYRIPDGDHIVDFEAARQEWVNHFCLKKAREKLSERTERWWINSSKASLPEWPEPKSIGWLEGVGALEVVPAEFLPTEEGISICGWLPAAASEWKIERAKQSFEKARQVWQARRGELPAPLCESCHQEMGLDRSTQRGMTEISLKCHHCRYAERYPKVIYYQEAFEKNGRASIFLSSMGLYYEITLEGVTAVRNIRKNAATLSEIFDLEIIAAQRGVYKELSENFRIARQKAQAEA